jgi:hypothetical protein
MKQNSVVELKKKDPFIDDPITDILRNGARQLLAQALEAEIELFIRQFAEMRDGRGRQRIVRNGYRAQRDIQSGIGPVPVRALGGVRDREPDQSARIHFESAILPPYLRKPKSVLIASL